MADAADRKVFLIIDNASYHVSRKTRGFAAGTQGDVTPFFPTTHAPEPNPGELVWKNVKHDRIERASIKYSQNCVPVR